MTAYDMASAPPDAREAFLLCTGTLFTERGTIVTVFIVCYALTSFVAGYIRFGTCLPQTDNALRQVQPLRMGACGGL